MTDDDVDALNAHKTALLRRLLAFLKAEGIDRTSVEEVSVLLTVLFDVIAMSIAATSDPERAHRTVSEKVLPRMVAYYQQSPDENFWLSDVGEVSAK